MTIFYLCNVLKVYHKLYVSDNRNIYKFGYEHSNSDFVYMYLSNINGLKIARLIDIGWTCNEFGHQMYLTDSNLNISLRLSNSFSL